MDSVLLLAVILPLVAFITLVAPKIIQSVFEMIAAWVTWPFM